MCGFKQSPVANFRYDIASKEKSRGVKSGDRAGHYNGTRQSTCLGMLIQHISKNVGAFHLVRKQLGFRIHCDFWPQFLEYVNQQYDFLIFLPRHLLRSLNVTI